MTVNKNQKKNEVNRQIYKTKSLFQEKLNVNKIKSKTFKLIFNRVQILLSMLFRNLKLLKYHKLVNKMKK